MSYSICIKCDAMVSSYQKYCDTCVRPHSLRQDETWHNRRENWYGEYNSEVEFIKDKKV